MFFYATVNGIIYIFVSARVNCINQKDLFLLLPLYSVGS